MRVKYKENCSEIILYLCSFGFFVFVVFNAFPEISIFLPKNSSELASWFQVIGSLGAVGAMLAIAIHERKGRERERCKKDAIDLKRAALLLSRTNLMNSVSHIIMRYEGYKLYKNSVTWRRFWKKYPVIYLFKIMLNPIKNAENRVRKIGEPTYDELMLGPIGEEFNRLIVNVEYLNSLFADFSEEYYHDNYFGKITANSDELHLRNVEDDLSSIQPYFNNAIIELLELKKVIDDRISQFRFL